MHAIDTAGSIDGRFSEGNPATGQRATRVSAAWLNDVQDNLLKVLIEGSISPTKGRAADLADAIKAIIVGTVGAGGGSVPTTRTVTGGGLATGGGDLTANRVITVPKATAAEIAAGTVDDKAITPAGLRDSTSIGAAGATLPGGLVIKRGSVTGSFGEGPQYVAFPAAFSVACDDVMLQELNPTSSSRKDFSIQLVSFDANGFTAYIQQMNASPDTTFAGFRWRAEGR